MAQFIFIVTLILDNLTQCLPRNGSIYAFKLIIDYCFWEKKNQKNQTLRFGFGFEINKCKIFCSIFIFNFFFEENSVYTC